MASTLEKLEKSRVSASVEIPAEDFTEAIRKAYLKERKQFNVQGFRKGSAPRKMIENFYGSDVFYEGAVDELWRDALAGIIEEHKIDVIGQPSVSMGDAEEGKPLTLTFTLSVYPEVKLGEYKGLEVEEVKPEVTKEDVAAVLDREREQRVRYSEVDRPVAEGDRLIFDYKGKIDDVYFEGGEAEKATIDIGSGRFIPGFEDGLIGLEANEDREISVTFPEDYNAEELAGKQAIFEVRIHEIREKEMPELDDDLAKDCSEFDTLDEWKEDIEAKLMQEAERDAKQAMRNAALAAAAENAELEVPDVMVENQIDALVDNLKQRLSYQGMTLEMYCQLTGQNEYQIREQMQEEAARRVRNQLVLDEITKAEKIEANEGQVEERIKELAESYGQEDIEKFKENLGESNIKYIGEEIAIDNTLDFLVDNSKLVKPKKKTKKAKKEEVENTEE